MRRLLGLVCAALLLGTGVALAAPPAATLDEVLAALEVRNDPSDFVIVVDTSLSMKSDDRYTTVVDSLASTLGTLQPEDHVALITFDDGARVAYEGNLGDDPQAILDELPRSPEGTQTDIGAGLDMGMAQLERPDARPAGALVLVTDGELDTKPSSHFAEPTSAGWDELRERAGALDGKEIATYALSLDENTDAALMADVFPDVQQVPVGEFAELLGDLDGELLGFQARQRLEGDLTTAQATLTLGEGGQFAPGTHETTLTATSGYQHVPLYLGGLGVESSGGTVTVEGLPEELVLQPGETVELPVTVTHDGTGDATPVATAETPWADALAELRTPFEPRLVLEAMTFSAPTEPAAPVESGVVPVNPPSGLFGMSWGLLAGIAGAVIAGLLLLWLAFRKRPQLDGSLTVVQDGRMVQELLLTGSSAKLQPRDASAGPRGTVSAMTGKRSRVYVKAAAGGEKARARLGDGERVQLGDYTLIYTAKRSRVLEMMG